MNKIFLTGFIMLFAIYHSNAQTDSAAKARQIIKIEQALMDAMPGNTTPWVKYLDEKWHITTEDGTGYNKAEFLKKFAPFGAGFSGNIKVIKPVFTFYEKTAIIHYVADEHEVIFGQMLHTTYATEDTWHQTGRNWKMLGSQVFEVPQLPRPVKVSNSVLKRYTGTYQLGNTRFAVITFKSDTLYIQKNNAKAEALLPETTTVFFRQSDTRGRKLFVKDTGGNMIMLERRNGNDVIWKRVK